MRHPEKHGATESRSDGIGLIAHLHHEGLMDIKPILNRGTGKRLRGGALLGAEGHQNEAL